MSYINEPEFWTKESEEIVLREYQDASIDGLRANIRAGIRSQILASMVGSGKTVMAAYLLRECWQKGKRGIFIVDRLSLLGQTSSVLDRYGIPHGVIQSGHPRTKPGELIQVASVQTLAKRGWPESALTIVDEAHVVHSTHKRMIDSTKGITIGLTATPFTKGLGKLFGGIVNVTTGRKLTNEGFLVPFKVWGAAEPDMDGVKVVAGEWVEDETAVRATRIIGDVVKEYQRHGNDGKAIVFGVNVAHCEELQRQALSAGIKAELYTYHTPDEARDYMLKEFRKPDSEIRWLISVAALSRGFDVPDVTVIIMCRPLKSSFSEFVQIIGRGLRSHPGKKDCVILDLAGNFSRNNFEKTYQLEDFMEQGVNELDDGKPKPKSTPKPREKQVVKCPKCGFMPCGPFCSSCGFVFPPKFTTAHEDGELIQVVAPKVAPLTKEAKTALYGELRYIQNMKGKSESWFLAQYKSFTGVWPRGINTPAIPPTRATLAKLDELSRAYLARTLRKNYARNRGGKKTVSDLFA